MTIAEYISSLLMIISFVVSAFMALIALKDNKKNKQQRRAYLVIIALGILLAIVLQTLRNNVLKRFERSLDDILTRCDFGYHIFLKESSLVDSCLYSSADTVHYTSIGILLFVYTTCYFDHSIMFKTC